MDFDDWLEDDGLPEYVQQRGAMPAPMPADYTAYFDECMRRLNDPAAAAYLDSRGIDIATAARCGIGYDPQWRSPTALNSGKKPPATPRIIIPTAPHHYIARDARRNLTDTEREYVKMNEGRDPGIFNAGALYAENADVVFVVEGAFDALSIIQAGRQAIALNSTANAENLLKRLYNRRTKAKLILALDNDAPGLKCAEKLRAGLDELKQDYIYATINGNYKDANEALCAVGRDDFCDAIERDVSRAIKPYNTVAYIDTAMGDDMELFESGHDKLTGYSNLDAKTGGLYSGFYVLAAISSLGKTTWTLQMADQLAAAGHDVLFFSLEQSRLELVSKSLARMAAEADNKSTVSSIAIRAGYKSDAVINAVKTYQQRIGDHLSIVEGNFDFSAKRVREEVERYIRMTGKRPVVIVDYLQILEPEEIPGRRTPTAREAVDATVKGLKILSRELNVTVFAISSINRTSYTTPIDFESLKESGLIEFSADVIFGLQLACLDDEVDKFESKTATMAEKRRIIEDAKKEVPMRIKLKCLKNRFGVCRFDCDFDYFPAQDRFVPMLDKTKSSSAKRKSR